MVKAGIPVFHHKLVRRQFVDFCKRLTWNGFIFRGRESCPEMTWNYWDLSLLKKFMVNVQGATMKYDIIKKPIVLERVEVNLLKSACTLLLEAGFVDDPLLI